ncbi:hypothetical protein KTT_41810 [Tengunoibacter tsumagoiensis]|uniref:Uncharacterized protein n=1 Tax=Tengunoibacter tsumagoiensis TaxID=2014871 RepID=A0A402A5D8_9CHLR|nr:hypothetical protein KTT_41810 [Tengunoibacter tsumagoiensis]
MALLAKDSSLALIAPLDSALDQGQPEEAEGSSSTKEGSLAAPDSQPKIPQMVEGPLVEAVGQLEDPGYSVVPASRKEALVHQ